MINRILAIVSIALYINIASAQEQTYVNKKEGITFCYKMEFKKAAINNAKHMLLKLEKYRQTISLSKWNYGIDDSYTIWDDEIVKMTKDNIDNSKAQLISLEKKYISTIKGKKKALVAITFFPKINMHFVTYQILHKGNLIQVMVSDYGKYDKQMQSLYDKYVYGLQLY